VRVYSLGEAVKSAGLNVGHLVVVQGEAGQLAQAPEGPLSKKNTKKPPEITIDFYCSSGEHTYVPWHGLD